jgi:hypothetical protein
MLYLIAERPTVAVRSISPLGFSRVYAGYSLPRQPRGILYNVAIEVDRPMNRDFLVSVTLDSTGEELV